MSETRESEEGWAVSGERVVRAVETSKRAYVALEAELQVPKRAPSTCYASLERDMQVPKRAPSAYASPEGDMQVRDFEPRTSSSGARLSAGQQNSGQARTMEASR
jgi:hypothetical protein